MQTVEPRDVVDPPLRMGWAEDPRVTPFQLSHAVLTGHRVAACGMRVTVIGQAWTSEPGAPVWRCRVCARAARDV